MIVTINEHRFEAKLETNKATQELVKKLPITITLQDYSGFEKVGDLGFHLPTSNTSYTTKSGDIMLYNGNQIVVFYGSNTWSYTKLAHVSDLEGWKEALGSKDVTITFSKG